ncbi:MAG: hypothetical protein ABSF15_14200 [Candidatus Sulfotelmatobacter sp.]
MAPFGSTILFNQPIHHPRLRRQAQTSEQLKDSVQTNFSRLGSELREANKEVGGKVQGSLVDLTGKIQELSATNEQKQDALRQAVELRLRSFAIDH